MIIANKRINLMAKDLKLHTFEYHQKNSLDLMFLEWSLASKYLGKILLIIGPRSSGKSTLIPKVVDKFTNCFSINRKKIFFEVYEDIGQKYFTDILSEASSIMESNITLSNLMYPDTSKLSINYVFIKNLNISSLNFYYL